MFLMRPISKIEYLLLYYAGRHSKQKAKQIIKIQIDGLPRTFLFKVFIWEKTVVILKICSVLPKGQRTVIFAKHKT